eukprot:TRINITY_DN6595_c1_g2_i2.p1 TRINITY_DN6595_c1_g2~~TRINITY_DN6595_c1_g2_i2.p1  ORF type:complete len:294 (+),score=44.67 TRINITY_DN6595_c1_g2_i2:69-884(+)
MPLQAAKPDMELSYGLGLLAFALLHACYTTILPNVVPGYKRFPDFKKWEWSNRIVALCVCSWMTVCTAWYWTQKEDLFIWDAEETIPLFQQSCIQFMVGYVLYDLVICFFVESELTYLFIVHHVLGAVSHLIVLTYGDGIGAYYSMLVYISEGSTPFMHIAWFFNELRNQEDKKNAAYWSTGLNDVLFKLSSALLLLCFFLFRVCLSPCIVYHSYTKGLPVWTQNISAEVGAVQVFILFSFMCINWYWFYCLIKLAVENFVGGPSNDKKSQ